MKAIVFYRNGKSELVRGISEAIWDDGGRLTLVKTDGTFVRFFDSEKLVGRVQLCPE